MVDVNDLYETVNNDKWAGENCKNCAFEQRK